MPVRDVGVLRGVPMFRELSERELRAVRAQMREESFEPGDEIVTEGRPGGRFYLIVEGRARVFIRGRTRNRLGPGAFFGEVSLLDGGGRTATVRADGDVKVLSMASWNFLGLLEEHWPLARKVLMELCRRVRELDHSAS